MPAFTTCTYCRTLVASTEAFHRGRLPLLERAEFLVRSGPGFVGTLLGGGE